MSFSIIYTFQDFYSSMILLKSSVQIEGIRWIHFLDFHLDYVFLGLLIFAIAEVFKVGVELRDEQKLTI